MEGQGRVRNCRKENSIHLRFLVLTSVPWTIAKIPLQKRIDKPTDCWVLPPKQGNKNFSSMRGHQWQQIKCIPWNLGLKKKSDYHLNHACLWPPWAVIHKCLNQGLWINNFLSFQKKRSSYFKLHFKITKIWRAVPYSGIDVSFKDF